jgi:hypothetical protein
VLETEETVSLPKLNLSYIRCMIITLSNTDFDANKPTKIYLCTSLALDRMLDELDSIDIQLLIDDDGISNIYTPEPFMLNHIYLN